MQAADAPPLIMATVRYNLACARAHQGRADEALTLLAEVFPTRPDMRQAAADDPDLAPLRDNPRFHELIKT
jgi:hypothetical protein